MIVMYIYQELLLQRIIQAYSPYIEKYTSLYLMTSMVSVTQELLTD